MKRTSRFCPAYKRWSVSGWERFSVWKIENPLWTVTWIHSKCNRWFRYNHHEWQQSLLFLL